MIFKFETETAWEGIISKIGVDLVNPGVVTLTVSEMEGEVPFEEYHVSCIHLSPRDIDNLTYALIQAKNLMNKQEE